MKYVLFGDDDFSMEDALASLREKVTPEELRDVNITVLEGPETSFEQLRATCDTVPFLADSRLVVVRGLLGAFEPRTPRGGRPSTAGGRDLGGWEGLPEYLQQVPDSTDLVFVDRRLRDSNPLLSRVRSLATVQTFPLPAGPGLQDWIRGRAELLGIEVEQGAVSVLAEAIGSDLRLIDLELQKLSLYCAGRSVLLEDVEEMVASVREANIFAAVDAVVEGRLVVALRLMHQLMDSGRPPEYLIGMIARQVRLLLLAKDLRTRRTPDAEMGKRLALSGYPLRKTLEQERKFSEGGLIRAHRKLLEADVSIKTGAADDAVVLDLLIGELAAR